jgi:hypothetical protein
VKHKREPLLPYSLVPEKLLRRLALRARRLALLPDHHLLDPGPHMRRPVELAPAADRAPRRRPEALSVRDAGDRAQHAYVLVEQEYRERAGGMRLLRQRAQREDREERVDAVLPDVCTYACEVLDAGGDGPSAFEKPAASSCCGSLGA